MPDDVTVRRGPSKAGTIHPGTTIGSVHLAVRDLERSVEFYQDRLGFSARQAEGGSVALGVGGPGLVVLWESPGAALVKGTTGLYHFAVLVPSRLQLARTLEHLLDADTRITGASDHLVSEALYLDDPDGNGIEIYRDRPRGEWPHENGELRMATLALDFTGLMSELRGHEQRWTGLPGETTIGHIHLHVSDLDEARHFYGDVLGFEKTTTLGHSALFLSAGGYHHHIGLNTWAGVGAPPPPPGAIGLRHFVVHVPEEAEIHRIAGRAQEAEVAVERSDAGLSFRDPSSNAVIVSARSVPPTR
jgi:catechol 2,3-dioxygenase